MTVSRRQCSSCSKANQKTSNSQTSFLPDSHSCPLTWTNKVWNRSKTCSSLKNSRKLLNSFKRSSLERLDLIIHSLPLLDSLEETWVGCQGCQGCLECLECLEWEVCQECPQCLECLLKEWVHLVGVLEGFQVQRWCKQWWEAWGHQGQVLQARLEHKDKLTHLCRPTNSFRNSIRNQCHFSLKTWRRCWRTLETRKIQRSLWWNSWDNFRTSWLKIRKTLRWINSWRAW